MLVRCWYILKEERTWDNSCVLERLKHGALELPVFWWFCLLFFFSPKFLNSFLSEISSIYPYIPFYMRYPAISCNFASSQYSSRFCNIFLWLYFFLCLSLKLASTVAKLIVQPMQLNVCPHNSYSLMCLQVLYFLQSLLKKISYLLWPLWCMEICSSKQVPNDKG